MVMSGKEIFAQNLKRLLTKNNISQIKICKDLDIKPTTFSDWINGKTYPRIDSLERISNYFDMTISEMLESANCSESIDIYQKLEEILILLGEASEKERMIYNEKVITKETIKLIKISLENTIRLTNEIVQKSKI